MCSVNPWNFRKQTEVIKASIQQFLNIIAFRIMLLTWDRHYRTKNAIKNCENKMLIIKKGLQLFSLRQT